MPVLDVPSRKGLAALAQSANEILPTLAVGFVSAADDHASVFYAHPHGLSQHLLSVSDLPPVLAPQPAEVRYADAESIRARPDGAMEWQLIAAGAQAIVSLPIPDTRARTRVWVALSEPQIPTDEQLRAFTQLVPASAAVLSESVSTAQSLEQLQRLELAAGLLPAIRDILDVRDVFDRLSVISQAALPHAWLNLQWFSDDLRTMTVYARSGQGADVGRVVPQIYPVSMLAAWQFDIVDDRSAYPREKNFPATLLGMRSSLRIAIRSEGRVLGGLGFHSREPYQFGNVDLAVGRRLADHVAVALIHHRLAEEGRRAAVLQERTANLAVVDGLMNTITGVLDVREVFDRIFEISQRALPHDAMSLALPSSDGEKVTLYARTGALRHLPVPWEQPLSDPSLVERQWEHVLLPDVLEHPRYAGLPAAAAGMRSLVVIPIRLDDQLRAWVNFWSATPNQFTEDDVPVARRIAAHITLILSHQRLAEQARLNEELRARTTNIELLDELLSALTDSGDLRDVFGRITATAGKVLRHDAAGLMVRLPDGLHARVYATSGVPRQLPEIQEIPPELLEEPDWDHHILDDLTQRTEPRYRVLVDMGFHSLMRLSIRFDGVFAGALIFVSKEKSAFHHPDVLIGRRMADRMAISLARDRELQASRRADEASSRAARLEARVRTLTEELDARTGYRRVVGQSAEWRQVLTQAAQVAATDTTVLLLGESGTGKEVVARFLHRGSPRGQGPFIALNCAALPEQLLEAELFGYERGAYTGATQSKPGQLEQAAGGTLFLDEVAEMSPSAQAKFLRVLQEREFQRLGGTRVLRTDARVVAATNRDLQRAISNGQFREDLYYRLNVFAIRLPPLRARRDDVLPLSEAFLAEIGRGIGRPPSGVSRDAREMLVSYPWPGNVRELRNILERAAILCDGGLITPEHLAISPPPSVAAPVATPPAAPPRAVAYPDATGAAPVPSRSSVPASASDLDSMERTMIAQALESARFNKSKAAKALGMTRRQLYARIQKYGLE